MKVLCRVLQADEVEQEITQRDQFNTDEVNLVATLVRESHQNSVDARAKGNDGPVRTAIRVVHPDEASRPYFERLFKDLRPHLEASQIDTTGIDFGAPRLLIVEDFGTTGLIGDFTEKADHGPFNNFWRRIGRSEKGGGKGGRWGLGKLVFSSASQIHTFFGLTVREGELSKQWLMGQAVLSTRQLGGAEYAPHVFFAQPGTGGLQLPTSNHTDISAFEHATGISREGRPGLSIAIPFVRDEITLEKLVPDVLRNYFFPILTDRLAVQVGEQLMHPHLTRSLLSISGVTLHLAIRSCVSFARSAPHNLLPLMYSSAMGGRPIWEAAYLPIALRLYATSSRSTVNW